MDEINRIDTVILLVPRRNYVQLLNLMFLLVGQDKATSNTYAIKISRYLGCSIDELVYGKKELKDNERDNNVLSGFSAEDLLDALKLIALKNKLRSDEDEK